MSTAAKKWLIAAAFLVVIGVIMIAAASARHWEFADIGSEDFETNTYEIREGFRSIKLDTDTADILFAASDNGNCTVVCHEEENRKHSVRVQDGTLCISAADDRAWYDHIGFGFQSPRVTVYLPKTEYDSLEIRESTGDITLPEGFTFGSINLGLSTGHVDCRASCPGRMQIVTSTGDICLQDVTVGELELTVTTGQVDAQSVSCRGGVSICVSTGETTLTDMTCQRIQSTGSTGSISLKNFIAQELILIERSTGDVRLQSCDAGELEISTDTGHVTGSLLSSKVFIARSDTGKVDVPETTSGGKCRITTDTGDIRITTASDPF